MPYKKLVVFVVCSLLLVLGLPSISRGTDFAAPKSYPVGTAPALILTGDFNGDGKIDIAVGNAGSNDVSILLGNNDGTFKAAVNSVAGLSPQQMAVGDFNGDGKLDLVVSNSGDGAAVLGVVNILLGKGDGTFQAPATIAADKYPAQLAVADFNEDKKLDLVVGDLMDGGVTLLPGKGDGSFQAGTVISPSSVGVTAMTVGDFNGDKHADVVVGRLVPVLHSAGSAALALSLLVGNGDGTFQASAPIGEIGQPSDPFHVVTVVSAPHFVAADFNGDGKLDLAVRYGIHAKFSPPCGGVPCPYLVSDDTNIFLGNGDGTFTGGGIVATFAHFTGFNLSAGDFNADGKLDLVTPYGGSGILELGRGDGTFSSLTPAYPWTGLGISVFVAVAELNGDTSPDLIVTDRANNAVAVILNHSQTSGTDLSLRLSQVPATPIEGTDFSYQVAVFNEGPQDATGVAVKETLPSGLKLVSATPSQGSCVGTTTITCDLGAMADVSTASIDFAVTPIAVGTFTDALQVAGSQADLNSKNDTASFTVTVLVPADISVSGSPSVSTAATGDKVKYTIQVANAGPGPATNVVLTDSISDGNLAVTALTTSQGSCTPTPGSITCTIGTMNAGAKVNISFALTMGPSENVSNNFGLSADTPDLNTADNSTALNVTVNPANLAVNQTASANSVVAGTQVTYTVTVKNNGPIQAANVKLDDTVPTGATISTAQPSQGSCTPPVNGLINCALGSLAASASATVRFGATPSAAGTMTNAVNVSSDGFDPDSSDNISSLAVAVTVPPDFSATAASPTLSVQHGGKATDVLTFTAQGGLASALALTCSVAGPAPLPPCNLNPASVTLGPNPVTSTLSVDTSSVSAAFLLSPSSSLTRGLYAVAVPFWLLGGVIATRNQKQRRRMWLMCTLILFAAILPVACGSAGQQQIQFVPKTFTVTVQAKDSTGAFTHPTTIILTVQ